MAPNSRPTIQGRFPKVALFRARATFDTFAAFGLPLSRGRFSPSEPITRNLGNLSMRM